MIEGQLQQPYHPTSQGHQKTQESHLRFIHAARKTPIKT